MKVYLSTEDRIRKRREIELRIGSVERGAYRKEPDAKRYALNADSARREAIALRDGAKPAKKGSAKCESR